MSNTNDGANENRSPMKDEFYEALFRDYFDYHEASVLYRYFLEAIEKKEESGKKKTGQKKEKSARVENRIRDFFNYAGYEYRPGQYNRETGEGETRGEDGSPQGVSFHQIKARERKKNNDHKKPKGGREQKKDQTLTLLEKYCEKIGKTTLFSTDAESRMPEEASVEKLFAFLNKEGKAGELDRIRIPLMVDSDTGCSLEIVGRSFYPSTEKTGVCAYLIYRFTDMESKQGFGRYTMARDTRNKPYRFSDYDKARKQFKIECGDALEDLLEGNTESESILKLPKELRQTFPRHFPEQRLNETGRFLKLPIGEEEKAAAIAYIEAPTKREQKRKRVAKP